VLFNICVLRLISFNFDYYWSFDRRATSPIEVGDIDKGRRVELTSFRRRA